MERLHTAFACSVLLTVVTAGCLGVAGPDGSTPSPVASGTASATATQAVTPTPTPTPDPAASPTGTTGRSPTPGTAARTPTPAGPAINATALETLVHARINERRRSHGLDPLDRNGTLREIARAHSRDMLARGYFDHTAPDGETRADRYARAGYECRVAVGEDRYLTGAENLYRTSYWGQKLSVEELAGRTVRGWMNSSTHREQILREIWDEEGIGVAVGTREGKTVVYVTQNFC